MSSKPSKTDSSIDKVVSFKFANRKGKHKVEIPLEYFLELSPLRIH